MVIQTDPTDQISIQAQTKPQTHKEHEPAADQALTEIKTTAEHLDQQALDALTREVAEAKRAVPEPVIPPDVADAGVKSPIDEAQQTISQGTTLELPIDQNQYQKGLHQKITGAVTSGVVAGASSLAALAIWIGRIIKMAHKHTMRVILRKEAG